MSLEVSISHRLGDFDLQVDFNAPAGVTALFGRSGAGKTTLVQAVAGLLPPDRGKIILDGTPLFDSDARLSLPVWKRRVGYVFQDARLFPHMSVRQNMLYGQRFAKPDPDSATLEDVADLLGIRELLDRRPAGLSGGERQRVAIGRAFLSKPRILLMDEPLAALDAARKSEILPYLEALRDETGLPILYVSHSVAEIARLATTLVVLENGRVAQKGPAEQVLSDPELVRQIGIREAGAVLPAHVLRHYDDGLSELATSGGRLLLPRLEAPEGSATRVRILAQDVILSREAPSGLSALNILPVKVLTLRDGHGPGVIVQMQSGDNRLLARVTRRSADALGLKPGDHIHAVIKSVSVARTDVASG